MNIKPLGDRVLLKIGPRPKELIISDKPEPLNQALVMAVGPDVSRIIAPGDAVLFSFYAGCEVAESKSERLIIVDEGAIQAKLEL